MVAIAKDKMHNKVFRHFARNDFRACTSYTSLSLFLISALGGAGAVASNLLSKTSRFLSV
jgi:hypothetical protein